MKSLDFQSINGLKSYRSITRFSDASITLIVSHRATVLSFTMQSLFTWAPKVFGIVPICLNNPLQKTWLVSYSFCTALWTFTFTLVATIANFFTEVDYLCDSVFYIVFDRMLFVGAVPVNIIWLWMKRNALLSVTLESKRINDKSVSRPRISAVSCCFMIFTFAFLTLVNIFAFRQFTVCSFYINFSHMIGFLYYWLIDCAFLAIHHQNLSSLRLLTQPFRSSPYAKCIRENFQRFHWEYIKALENLQKTNSIFGFYGLTVVFSALQQLISYIDFDLHSTNRLLELNLFALAGATFHCLRVLNICWRHQVSKNYVS